MPSAVRRGAAFAACLAACSWAVLILSAPLLASAGLHRPLAARVAAGAYLAGSVVCHQRPARSFHVAGVQLPVCARCTGLYLAGFSGLLCALPWFPRGGPFRAWSPVAPASWRTLLVIAALPLLASVAGEAAGLWQGSNVWRAASALPPGWAAGVMIVESLSFQGRL